MTMDYFSRILPTLEEFKVSEQDFELTEGGKIPVGEITEICGSPGGGKTNYLHQLAAYVAENQEYKVLFMDVDHSFRPEILQNNAQKVLSSIYTYSPLDVEDLVSKVKLFKKKVNVPIFMLVDTITNLFTRTEQPDKRRREILHVGDFLRKQVSGRDTIVVSNQIRSTIKREDLKDKEKRVFDPWRGDIWEEHGFIPALGTLWTYFIDNRLLLKRIGGNKVFLPVF